MKDQEEEDMKQKHRNKEMRESIKKIKRKQESKTQQEKEETI